MNTSKFSIRKTEIKDLPRLLEIYKKARNFMSVTGNPTQWGNTWPPENIIRKDIIEGNSYVCEYLGQTVGTFFFKTGKDIEPTYKNISQGKWFDDSPYGVVHRLASDMSIKGVGAFCLNWCYEQCKHLRIDTHADNIVMINLLRKLNFKQCGIIYVSQDNTPRFAFEKFN